MNILQVGILIFVIIESLNVLMLYFIPESKKGNGVRVFNVYMEIKDDDKYKDFVRANNTARLCLCEGMK